MANKTRRELEIQKILDSVEAKHKIYLDFREKAYQRIREKEHQIKINKNILLKSAKLKVNDDSEFIELEDLKITFQDSENFEGLQEKLEDTLFNLWKVRDSICFKHEGVWYEAIITSTGKYKQIRHITEIYEMEDQ